MNEHNTSASFYEKYCGLCCRSAAEIFAEIFSFLKLLLKYLWDRLKPIRNILLRFLLMVFDLIRYPYYKAYFYVKEVISGAKNEKELRRGSSFVFVFKKITDALFAEGKFLTSLFNAALPLICALFLYALITSSDTEYAPALYVNGEFLGYVENTSVWDETQTIVSDRLALLDSNLNPLLESKILIVPVKNPQYINKYDTADYILMNSGFKVEYAYSVYVDGNFLCASDGNAGIKKTLEGLIDDYRKNFSVSNEFEVEFTSEVKCDEAGIFLSEDVYSEEEVIGLLSSKKQETQYYTVKDGDTNEMITDIIGLSEERLEALNPGFYEKEHLAGEKIKYAEERDYLSIAVTKEISYKEPIPYLTEYKDNPLVFVGTDQRQTSGEDGEREVTVKVSLVNGYEVDRTVISETVLTPSVNEVILRGSHPIPPNGMYSQETASAGKFIWPVKHNDGYISEWGHWNGGYRGHQGVDFAAPYGTPIFAGAAGKVITVDWNSGWGDYVVIQHSNGLKTLYAHMSRTNAVQGSSVAQGENIGFVGDTGRAYGYHVHLEVISGGLNLNPRYYIDY